MKALLKLFAYLRPRGYKTIFMLNSVEDEILNAYKKKIYKEIWLIFCSDKPFH